MNSSATSPARSGSSLLKAVFGGAAVVAFLAIVFVLALAGSLVKSKRTSADVGTLPTTGPLFGGLLLGTVVLVSALTFFPALALGPIAEALR